jgi:hypothetical protein
MLIIRVERILPLLHRWGCEPDTLLYEPYTKAQLLAIIQHRLSAVPTGGQLLDESAIKLCAAKVSPLVCRLTFLLHAT